MKITYVDNSRMPTERAHGVHISQMCQFFADLKDVEVELVLPKRFNQIKQDLFEYYGVRSNFKVKKLPCLDLVSPLGHLGSFICKLTYSVFLLPYLLFNQTDVIYTRNKFFLWLVLLGRPVVFEAHTYPKKYWLYSFYLKRAKGIVVITKKLKQQFVEQGIGESKVLVAPDGVDLKRFDISQSKEECRRKLNLPMDKKIVAYTGHLYKWKGVDTLLESAKLLPDVLFVFVGGIKEDIEKFQSKANGLENVLVLGQKPYKEMPFYLKAADVLALPNSGNQEISRDWTSPLKMFEYMASKRPIVASGLPSIKEILNQSNAVLVEPDKAEAIVLAIENLLKNPNLSATIAEQAFNNVQQYSWYKRAESILFFVKN